MHLSMYACYNGLIELTIKATIYSSIHMMKTFEMNLIIVWRLFFLDLIVAIIK